MSAPLSPQTLKLSAPSRLHLGFLDMGNHLGRRFGSVGVGLSEPRLEVSGSVSTLRTVRGPEAARVHAILDALAQDFGLTQPVDIVVEKSIPAHSGLGSGTQLALAIGVLVATLHGESIPARQLARSLDRGNRSGIGIGAFEGGGFLVDGGRGRDDAPPPILSRLPFPEDWRFLLIFDLEHQGLHGAAEIEAFRTLPTFPKAAAAHLCHLTLMRMLPALVDHDFEAFASSITELQNTVGDHFAPAQGGRYTSPTVDQGLQKLSGLGAIGLGQSSWGPTGFVLCPTPEIASAWKDTLDRSALPGLSTLITGADHLGMTWLPVSSLQHS